MIDGADLDNRFRFHPANPETGQRHGVIRDACRDFAEFLNAQIPDGREKALAITHLEEVMMWANAAIARNPGPH